MTHPTPWRLHPTLVPPRPGQGPAGQGRGLGPGQGEHVEGMAGQGPGRPGSWPEYWIHGYVGIAGVADMCLEAAGLPLETHMAYPNVLCVALLMFSSQTL